MGGAARLAVLLGILLMIVPATTAVLPGQPAQAVPEEGPDIPPATAPDAVVQVLEGAYWENRGGTQTSTFTVPTSPTGTWDRIVLTYTQWPKEDPGEQDPWDRLCQAYIQGVEVLRCTTPRTEMTLTKDVTRVAALLEQGAEATAGAATGSYNQPQYYQGGQFVDMELAFYAEDPTGELVQQPAEHVVGALRGTTCTDGRAMTSTVTFPAQTPEEAQAHLFLTGHGNEEFWFTDGTPRVFDLLVDGVQVATAHQLPYTYAFIGIYGEGYGLHPVMWWSAHQGLDVAGVHTGVGEIPPYIAEVAPEHLDLLTGERTVELVGQGGTCYWPASASFLLD